MTLLQLQKLCERIGRQMTSADIPLKMYNCDIDLELLHGEDGDYWIDVKLIPDAKQFQQMLCEKVDYEVKIIGDIKI